MNSHNFFRFIAGIVFASALPPAMANSEKKPTSQDIAAKTEQQQLLKAKEASQQTQQREKQVLQRQASGDWEAEQKAKANAQFNQRESREQRYLREAKEAAAKDRKIPKPN
ncbi:hypothetical protein [Shewanella waksmanii]|uniref:hypothetical protein n=1 Tax=Shewanella waksmanii TaxID=213783 RepID=UPI0037359410